MIIHVRWTFLSLGPRILNLDDCSKRSEIIQELLEKYNIPFVGTGSSECRQSFDKVKNLSSTF